MPTLCLSLCEFRYSHVISSLRELTSCKNRHINASLLCRHIWSTNDMRVQGSHKCHACAMLSLSVPRHYYSLPGSSIHGIFQARILEWVAISYSSGSFWPRDQSYIPCIGRWILYHRATWEAPLVTWSTKKKRVLLGNASQLQMIVNNHFSFPVLYFYLEHIRGKEKANNIELAKKFILVFP